MALSIDDLLDDRELREFEQQYGTFDRVHYTISCTKATRKFRNKRVASRRGESLFLMQRSDGRVLLHTKQSYPEQAYRLPTGGVEWGESVVESMRREVFEETSLRVEREQLLAVITYSFQEGKRSAPFVTYLFHIPQVEFAGPQGEPRPQDDTEGITGFEWHQPAAMQTVIDILQQLNPGGTDRHDWGRFRAAAHEYVMSLDDARLGVGT